MSVSLAAALGLLRTPPEPVAVAAGVAPDVLFVTARADAIDEISRVHTAIARDVAADGEWLGNTGVAPPGGEPSEPAPAKAEPRGATKAPVAPEQEGPPPEKDRQAEPKPAPASPKNEDREQPVPTTADQPRAPEKPDTREVPEAPGPDRQPPTTVGAAACPPEGGCTARSQR